MDTKIHNNVANNSSSSDHVTPVRHVVATRDFPAHGNALPGNAENSDTDDNNDNSEKLDEAVREINKQDQIVQRELHFSIDKDSGKTVIKVMDLATKELIRQIPNDEVLKLARKFDDEVDLKLFSAYT